MNNKFFLSKDKKCLVIFKKDKTGRKMEKKMFGIPRGKNDPYILLSLNMDYFIKSEWDEISEFEAVLII